MKKKIEDAVAFLFFALIVFGIFYTWDFWSVID